MMSNTALISLCGRGLIAACLLWGCAAGMAVASPNLTEDGEKAYRQGDYPRAISLWQQRLQTESAADKRVMLWSRLAAAYQKAGDYATAYQLLRQALPVAEREGLARQEVLLRSQAGDILLGLQHINAAEQQLEAALKQARGLDQPRLLAHVLNNRGNLFAVRNNLEEAVHAYREAMRLAPVNSDLNFQAQANLLRLYLQKQDDRAATQTWRALQERVTQLNDPERRAFYRLMLGDTALQLQVLNRQSQALLRQAVEDLHLTRRFAEAEENTRVASYANGYLGEMYLRLDETEQAGEFIREAIFLSQEYPELLYRWEWLRGLFLERGGNLKGAEQAYSLSLEQLQRIRIGLRVGRRNVREDFYQHIQPVYYSMADVLLQQAAAGGEDTRQAFLRQTRDVLESLKLAEMRNFFRDPCLATHQNKTLRLDQMENLAPGTAILYPVILPDRLELLFSLPGQDIKQIPVEVNGDAIKNMVYQFQHNLQTRGAWRFIREARALYEWIIKPIRPLLEDNQINTLVVVPDSILRLIPLGALHDGKQYLVENFALVTTPGLQLTDSRGLPRDNLNVLLGGLSESVEEFPALPNVERELQSLKNLFGREAVSLLNREFLVEQVDQNLEQVPYSIVHIASHAQFTRDLQSTFLLAYDDRITMDKLESLLRLSQFRKQPVELLTLSACQTAAGDERAALGLAGVALKAGSRSALASLWFIGDESTVHLIEAFYQNLKNSDMSKAVALQKAQQVLIKDEDFRHPVYWAPFILIGNWL